MNNTLSHLQCSPNQLASTVLMPGNPERADTMAKQLKNPVNIGRYREFVSWTGLYNGQPVSIISTGIGGPSTAIAVEEAISAGAQALIRVGTCGGAWRSDIPCGSVILPTACIRSEGTTVEYLPPEFPAVADFNVIMQLRQQAKDLNIPVSTGINRTHDAYYGPSNSQKIWADRFTACRVSMQQQPIISSDMECSILYTLASIRGVKAGCVLAVNAQPEPLTVEESGTYVPVMKSSELNAQQAEDNAITLALMSARLFSNE